MQTADQATKFTTGTDGLVDIIGLKFGTYYLEEVPKNYVLLTNRIAFEVHETSYGTKEQLGEPEKFLTAAKEPYQQLVVSARI